jgi:carnitine 3-dehydrogenase
VVDRAEAFYHAVGKVTIRLRKDMNGHVANRLQAAVWREAIHLIIEGVASVEDVDKAMWAGPGLRWSVMGPTALFSLGAGDGGLRAFCDHFADTFNGWWDEMGTPNLDASVIDTMVAGADAAAGGKTPAELAALRDAKILAVLQAMRGL